MPDHTFHLSQDPGGNQRRDFASLHSPSRENATLRGRMYGAQDVQVGYEPKAIVGAHMAQVVPDPRTLADRVRQRLETSASMVFRGTPEIGMVPSKDPGGVPLPSSNALRAAFSAEVVVPVDQIESGPTVVPGRLL